MPPRYSLAEYKNLVRRSHNKRLLVEGSTDKRLFKILIDEFIRVSNPLLIGAAIDIDTAEQLVDLGYGVGNRDKVEIVSQSISGEIYADKFVGFSDREFRGFEFNGDFQDNINTHQISDRLIWSRGHSIENYFFDFGTLRNPLRDFSVTDYFDDALDLFDSVFESALRLACVMSLVAYEYNNRFNLIKSSISWNILDSPQEVRIRCDLWKTVLTRKFMVPVEDVDMLVERFEYWRDKIMSVDLQLVRWLCHGHIGLATLWSTYAHCVFTVCRQVGTDDPASEASRVLRAEETVRFNACANWWVQQVVRNHCEYPIDLMRMLDLIQV